jgi:hypothetical protein
VFCLGVIFTFVLFESKSSLDNYSNGFALLRHVISQMMADAGICAKFNYTVDPIRGRHSNLEHVNYF